MTINIRIFGLSTYLLSVRSAIHIKMVKSLYPHKPFLKSVSIAAPLERQKLIKKATRQQLRCLQEATLNVANGNIQVRPKDRLRLIPYVKPIKQVLAKSGSFKSKKRILVQKGGFLPIVLRAILPILASQLLNE